MNTRIVVITILTLALQQLNAEIFQQRFYSSAIGDSTRIIFATPDEITSDGSLPCIIMLHGWSGDETQWQNDADLQGLCNRYNILLILPDGGYDGWWLDPPHSGKRNYATHLHDEVISWAVKHFNASPDPGQRGILGLSMGGYGSFLQAFQNPASYAAVASLSGVMDLTRARDRYGISKALGEFESREEAWRAVNPIDLAPNPAPKTFPALLLICGWEDRFFPDNEAIFEVLKSSGYDIRFLKAPGTHSHAFWKEYVEAAVLFIVDHLKP